MCVGRRHHTLLRRLVSQMSLRTYVHPATPLRQSGCISGQLFLRLTLRVHGSLQMIYFLSLLIGV